MNTTSQNSVLDLSAFFKQRFAELIVAADRTRDPAVWTRTMQLLARHGLLETIVAAPFTRLGWERVSLKLDRSRLDEPAHLEEVSSWLSREWLFLIKRDSDPVSERVLATLTSAQLLEILGSLYINQSSGKGVAAFVLNREVQDAITGNPRVEEVFRQLDERFAAIRRTANGEVKQG